MAVLTKWMTDDEEKQAITGLCVGLVLGAVVHQFTSNPRWLAYGAGIGVLGGFLKAKTENDFASLGPTASTQGMLAPWSGV